MEVNTSKSDLIRKVCEKSRSASLKFCDNANGLENGGNIRRGRSRGKPLNTDRESRAPVIYRASVSR